MNYKQKKRFMVSVSTAYGVLSKSLSVEQTCKIAHVSRSTVYKWLNNTQKPDKATIELIQIKALGLIPDMKWEGWRVVEGELYSPLDRKYTPSLIEFIEANLESIKMMTTDKKNIRDLRNTNGLEKKPVEKTPQLTTQAIPQKVGFSKKNYRDSRSAKIGLILSIIRSISLSKNSSDNKFLKKIKLSSLRVILASLKIVSETNNWYSTSSNE